MAYQEPMWGNIGTELNKMLPGYGMGTAPDLSEVGFWGGGNAVMGALAQYMKDIENQRQTQAQLGAAGINAAAHENAAYTNALSSLYGHKLTADAGLAGKKYEAEALAGKQGLENQGKLDVERMKSQTMKDMAASNAKLGTADMFNSALKQARLMLPGATPNEHTQLATGIMLGLQGKGGGAPTMQTKPAVTPTPTQISTQNGGGTGSLLDSAGAAANVLNPAMAPLNIYKYMIDILRDRAAGGMQE